MSKNRCATTRLTPSQAYEVWERSDQATAFTRPDYLARLVHEVEWWGVERSGEVIAAWPLTRTGVGSEISPPPFCYYVGPLFAIDVPGDKYSRYWPVFAEAFSVMVREVATVHPKLAFSTAPGFTDMRPLQWWNFDHPEHSGFRFIPRYTARIDLAALTDESALSLSFASDRRRHVSRWMASPPRRVDDVPLDRIIELHDDALARSGESGGQESDSARHLVLRRLVGLVETGAGCMFGLAPVGDDRVQAVVIVLDGRTESNGVICMASSQWRDSGLVAWANWTSLLRSRSAGKRWFDFNGANSPGRAADKHLYSARPELYFSCTFGHD